MSIAMSTAVLRRSIESETLTTRRSAAVALAGWALTACLASGAPSTVEQSRVTAARGAVNSDAQVIADFTSRVNTYAKLHDSIEAQLPRLPGEASPKEIDTHQRAFASRMGKARAGAKHGDVFTPQMQVMVRKLMGQLFTDAKSRRQLRDSIMDDNPGASKALLTVNGRYPDVVPLSTMPPDVLTNLPKLPDAVEYRFVGENLILLDVVAHIVVDYVARALPR